ncbi:MAG: UDP-N-acetylmuramate dehydrogenase [Prolixibacteraceae bacterium]|nr:UDP-N-acetylmuramate dehydrogenase [Prolixibacteraceae bacterium]
MASSFKENHSLLKQNTFGIEMKCHYYFEFTREQELLAFFDSFSDYKKYPHFFIGSGSNLLFLNDYWDGLVLHPLVDGINKISEDKDHVYIKAGGGENWDDFVSYCVANNYGGIENLSYIPGKVGSVPVQNIGAYGVEVKDSIFAVEGFNFNSMQYEKISGQNCLFNYRDSLFKNKLKGRFIVTSVIFRLDKNPVFHLDYGQLKTETAKRGKLCAKNIRESVISIRKSKLPDYNVTGNAGSFFKNPIIDYEKSFELKKNFSKLPVYKMDDGRVKVSAGWLIEQCGWKGYREGDAGVYKNQALIIVNYGNASGHQIYELSEKIINSVMDRFSIKLEREVNVIKN